MDNACSPGCTHKLNCLYVSFHLPLFHEGNTALLSIGICTNHVDDHLKTMARLLSVITKHLCRYYCDISVCCGGFRGDIPLYHITQLWNIIAFVITCIFLLCHILCEPFPCVDIVHFGDHASGTLYPSRKLKITAFVFTLLFYTIHLHPFHHPLYQLSYKLHNCRPIDICENLSELNCMHI